MRGMISQELARELKEAGFPFIADLTMDCGVEHQNVPLDGHTYLLPNLSELIEACGYEFGSLSASRIIRDGQNKSREGTIGGWTALRFDYEKYGCGEPGCCPGCGGDGATPEEAVARLWLAVNKK